MEADVERAEGEEFDSPPFISCSLLINKPANPASMLVDLEAGDEGFVVTNLAMYEKHIAEVQGPEGDHVRRTKYMGPRESHFDLYFANADE